MRRSSSTNIKSRVANRHHVQNSILDLRHTYRALLSNDTPLEVQQELLRHADIRTTIGYGDASRAANTRVVHSILSRKVAK